MALVRAWTFCFPETIVIVNPKAALRPGIRRGEGFGVEAEAPDIPEVSVASGVVCPEEVVPVEAGNEKSAMAS